MRRRPSSRASAPRSPRRSGARPALLVPTHFALARHRPTHDLWVFALRAGTLVGVCGPLDGDPPPVWLLPHFDFASDEALANLPEVRAHIGEFERLA
jgi:hypothetical protein